MRSSCCWSRSGMLTDQYCDGGLELSGFVYLSRYLYLVCLENPICPTIFYFVRPRILEFRSFWFGQLSVSVSRVGNSYYQCFSRAGTCCHLIITWLPDLLKKTRSVPDTEKCSGFFVHVVSTRIDPCSCFECLALSWNHSLHVYNGFIITCDDVHACRPTCISTCNDDDYWSIIVLYSMPASINRFQNKCHTTMMAMIYVVIFYGIIIRLWIK